MYTRKQLSQRYKLSLATIRRLLQLLSIQPDYIQPNNKNLPTYYYSQQTIQKLDKYIIQVAQYKESKKKSCSICHKKYTQQNMIGTRCIDCYVQKCCIPIIFGKQPWKRVINNKLIAKALQLLKSATKKDL